MDVNTVSTFFAVGTVIIGVLVLAGGLLWLAGRWLAPAARGWETLVVSIGDGAIWLAWAMAVVATLGSLYYSEIAHFEPCTYCWYQRIAMYPLSLILGIAAFRRDRGVAVYAFPMAIVGGIISGYHYLIQQFPDLSAAECSSSVPCTAAYVWKFDFVSIPLMALVSFGLIVLMLSVGVAFRRRASLSS